MRVPINFLIALGKAALHQAGACVIADAFEIAKAAWEDWKGSPEERIAEVEALVEAHDDDVAQAVEAAVARIAAAEPEPVRKKLATFLKQVPSKIRQTQR